MVDTGRPGHLANGQAFQKRAVGSREEFAVGARIGGYRVLRKIGEGGMGAVYEVEHEMLHQRFALKTFFFTDSSADERADTEQRFLLEARVTAQMRHTGIVAVQTLDRDAASGSYYFVMEYVAMGRARREALLASAVGDGKVWRELPSGMTMPEGEAAVGLSLEDLLQYAKRQHKLLNPGVVRQLLLDVADALSYAHRFGEGILHRDIKPANILIRADGHAVITDFGVAKVLDKRLRGAMLGAGGASLSLRLDEGGEAYHLILGTREYMAPELLSGAPPSPKTDLFALGVVAYQLLTGERFGSGAKTPSELGFSKAWDAPIVGCLYTDPADRWASVAEFQRALEGLKPLRLQTRTGRSGVTRTVPCASLLSVPLATPAPTVSEPRRGGWGLSVVMALAAAALGLFWWGREHWRVKAPPLAFPEVPAAERFFLSPGREGWTLMRVHPDACGVVRVPEVIGGKHLSEVSAEVLEGCRHVTELRLPPGLTRLAANKPGPTGAPSSTARPASQSVPPQPQAGAKSLAEAMAAGILAGAGDARPAAGALLEDAGAIWQVRKDRASVELVGTTAEPPAVWIVPAQVQGLPVVAISKEALQDTQGVFERLVLPSSLREIGPEAFIDCSLWQLELPEGLETIGVRAFYKTRIKQIRFPSTLKRIGDQAFDSALFGCPVVLPEGVSSVGHDAFARCNFQNQEVSLPSTLKRLPRGTFGEAWDIAKIDLKGVTEVPSEALTQLPDNSKGGDTLDLIFGQQCVTFAPKSLSLRKEAIARRTYLRLFFPQGAEVSFARGFLETPETEVEVHRDSWITHWDRKAQSWAEGPLPRPEWTTKALEPKGRGLVIVSHNDRSASEIRVPEQIGGVQVSAIGRAAFEEAQATSITLPKTLRSIDNAAFIRMRHLKRIVFPPELLFPSSGRGAWGLQWCQALEEVVFQGAPECFPAYFFSHCESLKRVIVRGADKPPRFIKNPFESTSKQGVLLILEPRTGAPRYFRCKENEQPRAITAEEAKAWEASAPGGATGTLASQATQAPGAKSVQRAGQSRSVSSHAVEVEGLTFKWREALQGMVLISTNRNLTGVVEVPEQVAGKAVVAIGPWAFSGTQATEILLPKTLKYIGKAAFLNARQLKRLEIPPNVVFRDDDSNDGVAAFQNCHALEEIIFLGPISFLPPFMTAYCDNLKHVIIRGRDQLPQFVTDPFQERAGVLLILEPRGGAPRYFRFENFKQPVELSAEEALAWGSPTSGTRQHETFTDDNGRYTVQPNNEGGCTLIAIQPTLRGSSHTVEIPADCGSSGPITRVAAGAMRFIDATMQLRLRREVYFEPGAFPGASPRAIAFPSNARPIFSRATFTGKLPEFYAFRGNYGMDTTPPKKVSPFVKDNEGLYLVTARGCLLYQLRAMHTMTSLRLPSRVQGVEVVGILPHALKDCPNLKEVIRPTRADFTVYPGAFNGTQCSQ